MLIRVCRECGHIHKGCTSCSNNCFVCGGELEKRDYVQFMLAKQRKEENANDKVR